jgi:hypothetical protein
VIGETASRTIALSKAVLWKAIDSSAARAMWATVLPRLKPTMAPLAEGFQYGAPSPVKDSTNTTPPESSTEAGQAFHVGGGLDGLQAIAQPLHHGAADEDAAFERILFLSSTWQAAVLIKPLCDWAHCSPVCSSMKQPVP